MTRAPAAAALAARLDGPLRLGLFGQRGVGKTTLLAMLYREADGGRLPGLRLAAGDARTAEYLADRVRQLEAGQTLPATLGETELKLHLYHQGGRLELLVRDYQGEHVALGRTEPIREFLRDCDAVWLCLDASLTTTRSSDGLRAQQEAEQVIEDYLALPTEGNARPMALVLTKADLLTGPAATGHEPSLRELAAHRFGITWHALASHCPQRGLFAVSSLGAGPLAPTDKQDAITDAPEISLPLPSDGGFQLRPTGLAGPLAWLAQVLRARDTKRLERLWLTAKGDLRSLTRGVEGFARRYPDDPAAAESRRRLAALRRQRLARRGLIGAACALVFMAGLWGYDAVAASQAARFAERNGDDPAAVRAYWGDYASWHPTRHLWQSDNARAEEQRLRDLDTSIRARELEERLALLRREASDSAADPEAICEQFVKLHADFPEYDVTDDLHRLRQEARERRARRALDDLERAEAKTELTSLVALADAVLRDHPGTAIAVAVRGKRAAYLARLDERAIEVARAYSSREPLNFHTRREHYQQYLDRHPEGDHSDEARAAMTRIEVEWDKHDYRRVRDHYVEKPADLKELDARSRAYLAAHPRGEFRETIRDLLRWSERVRVEGSYMVKLKSGSFDKSVARWFRKPDLSVEVEVNGVKYGPSNIAKNAYDPEWDFEFPRPIKWKLGDSVTIRVFEHDYWKRKVVEIASESSDSVAMRMLSGEVAQGPHRLVFESDFGQPVLPKAE